MHYYSPILQKLPLKDETSGSLFNILLCKSLVISTYCRDHSHLINILPTNVPCQIEVDLLVILSIPGLLQECTLVDGESNEGPLTSLFMIGLQSPAVGTQYVCSGVSMSIHGIPLVIPLSLVNHMFIPTGWCTGHTPPFLIINFISSGL